MFGIVISYYSLFESTFTYSISWDDTKHVMLNPHLQEIDFQTFLHFWKEPYFGMYIPVAYDFWGLLLWFTRDFLAFDFDSIVVSFRIANWILHGLNSFLLFIILKNLVHERIYAWIGVSLFLFHPLNSELVLWISEFRGLLAMFFVLSAAICFVKDHQLEFKYPVLFYFAPVFLILGAYSKPNVVVFLLATMVYTWMFRRNLINIVYSSLSLILGVVPGLMVMGVQTTNDPVLGYGLTERLIVSGSALAFYVQKIFIPTSLSHVYQNNISSVASMSPWYILIWIVLTLSLSCWLKYRTKWWIFVGVGFLSIAPNLGLISFSYQEFSLVANRYAYPLVVVLAIFVGLFLNDKTTKYSKPYIIVLFVVYLGVYASEISEYQKRWVNESTLWTHELMEKPERLDIRLAWTRAYYDPLVSSYISYRKNQENKEFKQLYHQANTYAAPYIDNEMDQESHGILTQMKPWVVSGDFHQVNSFLNSHLVAHKIYHKSVVRLAVLSHLNVKDMVRFYKNYGRYLRDYGTPSNIVLKEIYQLLINLNHFGDAASVIYRGLIKYPNDEYWVAELKVNRAKLPLHMRLPHD